MIAGQRAAARRKARAADITELFGVHLDWNAQAERGIKEPLGLARVEGDLFAKDVDRINEPFGMQRRQPLACDGVEANSGGRVCAARSVVFTVTGKRSPSRRAARSIFASSASVSP
jgi:hypothetical protein